MVINSFFCWTSEQISICWFWGEIGLSLHLSLCLPLFLYIWYIHMIDLHHLKKAIKILLFSRLNILHFPNGFLIQHVVLGQSLAWSSCLSYCFFKSPSLSESLKTKCNTKNVSLSLDCVLLFYSLTLCWHF